MPTTHRTSAPYITVIGGANVDIRARSLDSLQAHDSNPGETHIAAGGVARNIAENIARHGVSVKLISVVGNDPYGDWLLRATAEVGVDMQQVQKISGAATSTYVSVHDAMGEMQVAVNDMAIIDELTPERLEAHADSIAASAVIVIDTNLSVEALDWICTHSPNVPIFADAVSAAKVARLAPFLPNIHSLKINRLEAAELSGLPADDEQQLEALCNALHERGITRVFVTRGADGAWYSAGGECAAQQSTTLANLHNVTGAGDAFLAALACAWLKELPTSESVAFALTAAQDQLERNDAD